MKKLHKIIKALLPLERMSFSKRRAKALKTGAADQIQLGGNFYSKDADSILIPISGEENEFLFI